MVNRSLLFILSLFVFTTGIQAHATENNMKQNLALVDQYFIHFNNHDWDQMAAMYSDPAKMKDPSIGTEIVTFSRADIVEKYSGLGAAIPDVKDTVIKTYVSGDHVIVEFESSGTAPDGNQFILPIAVIFKFENGLITEDFSYFDNFEE